MQRRSSVRWQHLKKGIFLAACALVATVTPAKVQALELADQRIEIHGYGHQGFLLTNGNKFFNADSHGTWDYNALALLFSAKVADNTTIWAQLFAGSSSDVRLDWAFVDYRFNNDLSVRGGQIKLPMGIYNEIRDIKYLQLSTIEPAMYQEEAEMFSESFRGVGASYNREFAQGGVMLDLYGGQPVIFEEVEGESLNQLVGGRISWRTPVEGLSLLASASTSEAEEDFEKGRKTSYVGSLDYVNHDIDFKAEYLWMKQLNEKMYGYYAQAGYTFFDKLTPFVRYDYITTDRDFREDPSFYQKDLTVGVGYKINGNVSLKAEDHFISGYALPVAAEEVEAGAGKTNWNLFAASINFMF